MNIAIIIPSRIGSTRLPRKALAQINGKTLIERCYDSAMKTKMGDVFVATDCEEIASVIKKVGGNVLMTPSDLPSGTDRIFNAYQQIGKEYDYIVNLQGDVPNIHKDIITNVIETIDETKCDIATAVMKTDLDSAQKPSCVKCVATQKGKFLKALYFSRSCIPYNSKDFLEHIGIYAYTPQSLKKFISLNESFLEKLEKLEQLRALENDMSIYASIIDSSLKPINIDTEQDLAYARKVLKKFQSTEKYQNLAKNLKENLLRRKEN